MPQLDILTFIHQILNTVFFFLLFYYLVSFHVLPSILFTIWIRNKISDDIFNIFKIKFFKKKKLIFFFFKKFISFLSFLEFYTKFFKDYDTYIFFFNLSSFLKKTYKIKIFLKYANKRIFLNNTIYNNLFLI